MLQPITPAWVLVLLVAAAAQAQPAAALVRRVTLSGNPDEPLSEVHVAANVPTVFLFDAPIESSSVQLDASRLQVVDVGKRSLIVMPRVSPGAQEQWVLRVRYAAGAGPEEWAAFALVSRPPQVDARIDVVRRAQLLEACQAALAEARLRAQSPGVELWTLAERLGGRAVAALSLQPGQPQNGLRAQGGMAYRFATRLLLVVPVENAEGEPPWAPTQATLRSNAKGEQGVPVRVVAARPERIAPGEHGQVAVETALPPPEAGVFFTLELREPNGRSLTLDSVQLPPAPPPSQKGSER